MRNLSFPHRIVNVWNDIPESIARAEKLTQFEAHLDRFMSPQELIFDYEAKYVRQKAD